MTYTHFTVDEITIIESYLKQNLSAIEISSRIKCGKLDYFLKYKENKSRCGRKPIKLSEEEKSYIGKNC